MAVPAGVHAGMIGVAPSRELFDRARAREAELAARGATRTDARAGGPPAAADGLRTYPPRENGGNIDMRDLVAGAGSCSRCRCPGRCSRSATCTSPRATARCASPPIETGGSATVRVGLRAATAGGPRFPGLGGSAAAAARLFATTGIPLADDGEQGTSTSTSRRARALIEMLGWLEPSTGWSASPPTCS